MSSNQYWSVTYLCGVNVYTGARTRIFCPMSVECLFPIISLSGGGGRGGGGGGGRKGGGGG